MDETHDDVDAAGNGDSALDPREAAELMEQATIRARREFETSSPALAALGAGVFLFGYGAVWWSMRDQHSYAGPATWAIVVLYALIVVSAVISRGLLHHATAGIGGWARRQMIAGGIAVAVAGIAAWTVQGALRYLGVSFEIIYGVYGPTVPLIAIAAAATGFAASRAKWPEFYLAIAIVLIAAGTTFFGPDGAWGLTGVGCAAALLVYAAVLIVRLRRHVRA
jgi:hypothetical protein